MDVVPFYFPWIAFTFKFGNDNSLDIIDANEICETGNKINIEYGEKFWGKSIICVYMLFNSQIINKVLDDLTTWSPTMK